MKAENKFSSLERLSDLFLILMATVFLLSFGSYSEFSEIKRTAFFTICGGYVILSLVVALEGVLIGSYNLKSLCYKLKPVGLTEYLILLYLLFTLISAAISNYPQAWIGGSRNEGAVTITIYVLTFYSVAKFCNPKNWTIYLLGGVTTLFSILCIIQLFGFNPFNLYPAGYNYYDAYTSYSGAYLGTIGNVDFVAAFFCLCIPILFAYLLRFKEKMRFWLIIPIVCAVSVLVKMGVLAGIVGVFGGILLFLPIIAAFPKKASIIYYISCAILAITVLTSVYLIDYGNGIFHEIHSLLHGVYSDTFGSGRLYIWKSVLSLIPDNFFFGTGPDTLLYAEIEPFQRYDESLHLWIGAYIDTAHNEYLNILYHQGVFAVLAYLGALCTTTIRWIKNSHQQPLLAVLGSGLVCYAIQAVFGISQCITSPFFWVIFGLLEKISKNKFGGTK